MKWRLKADDDELRQRYERNESYSLSGGLEDAMKVIILRPIRWKYKNVVRETNKNFNNVCITAEVGVNQRAPLPKRLIIRDLSCVFIYNILTDPLLHVYFSHLSCLLNLHIFLPLLWKNSFDAITPWTSILTLTLEDSGQPFDHLESFLKAPLPTWEASQFPRERFTKKSH